MATNIVTNDLPHLVKLLVSLINGFQIKAEKHNGRPYVYSDKTITKAFVVMAYFRLRSFRSLSRFLSNHKDFARACDLDCSAPSYRTLSRRLNSLSPVLWFFTYQVMTVLVHYHVINLNTLSTDSSLLEAKGIPFQKKNATIIPTDKEAAWGWSESRNWVYGYKIHLTSTVLTKDKTLIPVVWQITTANRHDSKLFIPLMEKVYDFALKEGRRIHFSLGDKGYDHNKNYAWCLNHKMKLITPVRRFKKHAISKIKQWALAFIETIKGKRLYRRRADNERLFSQMKDVFLIDPLPVCGIRQVNSYLSVVCLSYLLGILYNYLNGRSLRAIKSLVA